MMGWGSISGIALTLKLWLERSMGSAYMRRACEKWASGHRSDNRRHSCIAGFLGDGRSEE